MGDAQVRGHVLAGYARYIQIFSSKAGGYSSDYKTLLNKIIYTKITYDELSFHRMVQG